MICKAIRVEFQAYSSTLIPPPTVWDHYQRLIYHDPQVLSYPLVISFLDTFFQFSLVAGIEFTLQFLLVFI